MSRNVMDEFVKWQRTRMPVVTSTQEKPLSYRRKLLGLLFAVAVSAAAAVVPLSAAHAAISYTMQLSSTSATVRAGETTTTTISFDANRRLYRTRVDLGVSGLPSGVTASFSPAKPRIGCSSTLTFTTEPSSPVGAFTVTVTAITITPSDPIGTSTTFDLTISAP
jgi:hypothetical protein